MLTIKTLISKLKKLTPQVETGVVFRSIHIKYQNTALSAIGSLKTGGRYNIGQKFSDQSFEALYTSDSPVTAFQEVRVLLNGLTPVKSVPYITLSLEYTLHSVLDLTDMNIQDYLGTNLQELTGNWHYLYTRKDQIAPTQQLGKAIYDLRTIEAIKVPCSFDLDAYNLVIFPERIWPNSLITVYDPSGTIQAKIPE